MVRTKKDVVTEFRRAAILAAASRAYAERGVDGTTIDAIARAAGVAKGTVYIYYRSKQEIQCAVLRRMAADFESSILEALAGVETVDGKIRAFIASRLRYFEENRALLRMYRDDLAGQPGSRGALRRLFHTIYAAHAKVLAAVLQQGVDRRVIRPLPAEKVAFAICHVTRGVIGERAHGWSRASLDEDADFIFDLVWRGLVRR